MIDHEQHRGTDAACRGKHARVWAVRRLAGDAHKFQQLASGQGGSRSGTVGQSSALPLTLPLTCRSRLANGHSGIFIRVARVVSSHAAEPVRHVLRRDRRLVLTHAGTGRFFPCAGARQSCRAQIHRIELEPAKQSADPFHVECLSSPGHEPRDSERPFANGTKFLPREKYE